MRKTIFFLLVLVFGASILWAQVGYIEPPLVIGVDSELWFNDVPSDGFSVHTITIVEGETVYGRYGTRGTLVHFGEDYVTNIIYNNQPYYIYSNNLRPVSGVYLPDDWITTIDAPKKWVRSYYLDALRSQNRNIFLQYEKTWIEFYTERVKSSEGTEGWYDFFTINALEPLVFNGAGIIMGGFATNTFFITNIVPFNNGYKITMASDKWFYELPHNNELNSLPFPLYSERQNFDMIFIPDGDYMDVYLDSLDNKFATFAKVDAWVLDEVKKLVRTNTCDISQMRCSRRADGRMDYPPPVDMSGFRSSHATTDRLRLRDDPTTVSLTVTTLEQGTEVQVLETGPDATIDGLTAPWVKVLSANGYTGWCFSGYLEPLQVESPIESFAVIDPVSEMAVDHKVTSFLFVLIGGVVLIVGIVVLVLIKRKRS